MDLIIFKDSLYHLISIDLKEVIDCFDYCNVIREKLTTYLEHINKYVI